MAEFLSNVLTKDVYSDAVALGPSDNVRDLVLSVLGEPAYGRLWVPVGHHAELETAERLFEANTFNARIVGAQGIQLRSAITGKAARIFGELTYPWDPAISYGTQPPVLFNADGSIAGPVGGSPPVVYDVETYTPAVAASTQPIPYPLGVLAGDLILVVGCWPSVGAAPNAHPILVLFPNGFETLFSTQIGNQSVGLWTMAAAYRVADGTEVGTFNITTNDASAAPGVLLADRPAVACLGIAGAGGFAGVSPTGNLELSTAHTSTYLGNVLLPSATKCLYLFFPACYAVSVVPTWTAALLFPTSPIVYTILATVQNLANNAGISVQQYDPFDVGDTDPISVQPQATGPNTAPPGTLTIAVAPTIESLTATGSL